jgi:hypothetical protein
MLVRQQLGGHPFNQIRGPAKIGSDDGLPVTSLGFDNRYRIFWVV